MARFTCNNCGGHEVRGIHTTSYVCPWCGDGVMQPEDDDEDGGGGRTYEQRIAENMAAMDASRKADEERSNRPYRPSRA